MLGDAAKRLEYIGQQVRDQDSYRNFITTVGILLYATGHDARANELLQAARGRGQDGLTLEEIVEYVRPVGNTAFDKFVPWVYREFSRLEYDSPQDYINAANALASIAPQLPVWQRKTKVDLNRLRMPEVVKEVEAWLAAQQREAAEPGNVVFRFSNGWTVQRLITESQILSEGHAMRHCMRDPAKGYFARTVCELGPFSSPIRLYSLRDPAGVPHVTFLQDVRSGEFEEIRTVSNKPVPAELTPFVDEFVAAARGAALGLGSVEPVSNPLNSLDEDEGYLRYLFHTTSYGAVDQIAEDGLKPRQGRGVYQHGGYDIHSQGKIFAADGDAALEWFGKIQDQLEHHASDWGELDDRIAEIVPVMLRIDLDSVTSEPQIDELGSRDVIGGTSYYFTKRVKPGAIEYWDPKSKTWEPIEDGLPDARLGVREIEYYDDEGNPIDEADWDGEVSPGISAIGPYDRGGFKPSYRT